MKPAMKKCLTAVLAATVSVSVFSVPANAVEPAAHVLSIDIDSDTFRDVKQMYCFITDETDSSEIVKWGAKKGAMTKDANTDVWRYDLDGHGITLDPAHSYTVVFSDNWIIQTEDLTIADYDSEKEYTAVFSEIFTMKSFYSKPVYKYKWLGENEKQAGADVFSVRADKGAYGSDRTLTCQVYDETAEAYVLWCGRMTLDENAQIWSFDFGMHGIALEPGHTYTVTFGNAEPLTIDSYDRSKDYTDVFSEAIGKDDILFGDANGDGEVNITDVTFIQLHLAERITLEGDCLTAADANGDGEVTVDDATQIQKYLADEIDCLG